MAVEPELKFQAPAFKILKRFGSGSRMIWSIETWKPLYYLYNLLTLHIEAVESEPKFQASASPSKRFGPWLQLHNPYLNSS